MPLCGCGCSSSSIAVESPLGVDASDAGVDVGLLILVDPPWWDPFRQPLSIDAAAPAFLQKMRVVVSAEQGHVVKIGKPAQDPIPDVMPVAVARWVRTAGKRTSGVSGDQCHGLAG